MHSERKTLLRDFNTRSSIRSTPVSTPKKKVIPQTQSPYKTPIHDPKLMKDEEILCQKEDQFLSELHEFHQEMTQFEESKDRLTTCSRKLAKDSISLLSMASNLSVYQQKLEQRAALAQQILSDPIEDLTQETALVEQIEAEFENFKKKMPEPPSQEEIQSVENQLFEVQQIKTQNSIRSQQLERRRLFLENQAKLIEAHMKEIEGNANEVQDKDSSDNENQDNPQDQASNQNIIRLNEKKEQLTAKQEELNAKRTELDTFEKSIQTENEQKQKELDDLQKTLDDLKETKNQIDQKMLDLNELTNSNAQLETERDDLDQELARLRRKLENQKSELEKIEKRKADLVRRKDEIEEKKKQIEEKSANIVKRREELTKAEDEYNKLVDELDESKRLNAEKKQKFNEQQKILEGYQEKIKKLNNGEAISDVEPMNTESTLEKEPEQDQNLLNEDKEIESGSFEFEDPNKQPNENV